MQQSDPSCILHPCFKLLLSQHNLGCQGSKKANAITDRGPQAPLTMHPKNSGQQDSQAAQARCVRWVAGEGQLTSTAAMTVIGRGSSNTLHPTCSSIAGLQQRNFRPEFKTQAALHTPLHVTLNPAKPSKGSNRSGQEGPQHSVHTSQYRDAATAAHNRARV